MRAILFPSTTTVLLILITLGCGGYGSGSGAMAAGAPNIADPLVPNTAAPDSR